MRGKPLSYLSFITETFSLSPSLPVLHVQVAPPAVLSPALRAAQWTPLTHVVDILMTFPVVPGLSVMSNLCTVLWPRGVVRLPALPVGEVPGAAVRPQPGLAVLALSAKFETQMLKKETLP